jgi:hypothetical protein
VSIAVSSTRLAILQLELSRRVRPITSNHPGPVYGEVDMREFLRIVDELRRRRGDITCEILKPRGLSVQLMGMNVGDVIVIEPRTQTSITSARTTARKNLRNTDARWKSQTQPDGKIRIERMPDGSPHVYGKTPSPVVAELAAMNVHGRHVFRAPRHTRTLYDWKAKARERMERPSAQWKFTNLVNGDVRAIRVA